MDNVQGVAECPLLVFGGLVAEVNPSEIPSGSSPVACDVDYSVASVKTRDGIQNVYSYAGFFVTCNASSGANITDSGSTGEVAWTNPLGITNGSCASVSLNSTGIGNPQITTVNSFGAQGTVPAFTVTVTAGPLGISVGDFAILLVHTSDHNFATPFIAGITDSLGNSWSNSATAPALNRNKDLVFSNFGSNEHTYSLCSALMNTAVPAGGTFSVTVSLGPAAPFVPATLECDFIAITGVSYFGGNGANWLRGSLDTTLPPAAQFRSNPLASQPSNPFFYMSFALPFSAITAIPAGYSSISGFTNTIQGASFFNVGSAIADDLWTQTSVTDWAVFQIGFLVTAPPPSGPLSQELQASEFSCLLTIPASSSVVGMEVSLTGFQSNQDPSSIVTLNLLNQVNPAPPRTFQLPPSSGTVILGGPNDTWGQPWTRAELTGLAFNIQATSNIPTTFTDCAVVVTVWYTPPNVNQFDYVKSFEMTDGGLLTLALDDLGVFWQEDVINNPRVLTPFYTAIEPDTFAVSATLDDREFIALSDLQQGTDMPRQYNGQWVDRISQLGPAAPPSVTVNSTTYPIVSVAQPTPLNMSATIRALLWSAGPEQQNHGNIVTLYANLGTNWTTTYNIVVGSTFVIQGLTDPNISSLNNDLSPSSTNPYYTVTSVGTAMGAGGTYSVITFTAPLVNHQDKDSAALSGGTFAPQLATVTTSVPVPNIQVGSQISLSGVTPSTWNGTYVVQFTPNAAQLSVNTTALTGNVATYSFTLISGSAPTVGEQVTVQGTANGDGIFNVVNASITAVTPSTFSVALTSPPIASAPEVGTAIINGTEFQFDPLKLIAPGTGGVVVGAGGLGAGTRGCVYMWLTRNGYLSAPSPPFIFTVGAGANSLNISQLQPGPPNVVARIVAFTGADGATQLSEGGFYFWIPEPVSVLDNGVKVTYTATKVNDNSTTTATFNFTDAVLLAALSITNDGDNNFAQIELGSCLGVIPYSERLFAWGEQNKIQNLLNFSFDGGIGQVIPPDGSTTVTTFPLGWTLDPLFGAGSSVIESPLFGDAYYIQNTTGLTQAKYGMITQPAFQDVFGVPIFLPQTSYNIRVTLSSPSDATSGNLVVDLFSPSTTLQYGAFTVPLATLSQTMQIETGALLTNQFQVVPSDLLIRIYATNLPPMGDVLVDRIEPFDVLQPVLTTQLRGSYVENFEAFDGVTGNLGAAQNQQPVRNAFVLFDNLYIVKTRSLYETTDNGTTEPNFWQVHEVSNKCGTPSIHGMDVGEGWALIAGEPGLYIFEGGQPVKVNPEIDPVWKAINWKYGHTLWLRNDTDNRRILIGVPIATPNKWMPNFPPNANPTQPNVVLMCNYKECMTAGALQGEGPIRLTYMGDLKTYPLGRKWAAWSIEACYADFIDRGDNTFPVFYCADDASGKIYQQIPGLHDDDGFKLLDNYLTYGFPKTQEAEAKQIGLHMLLAHFMTMLVVGSGNLGVLVYPDTPQSPYADALIPLELQDPPQWGDTEIPLNETGQRFFVGVSSQNVGDYWELSRIVMAIGSNPWAPTRGGNF